MWNASRGSDPAAALRFAEIYTKALDRLGDPRPGQRVGALHTLEALAQDSPVHRQAIVNVFCAILRAPAGQDAPAQAALQRTLALHLHPKAGPAHWSGVSLDLTGATLTDLDLSGCRVDGALTLDRAVLRGQARLRGMVIRGPVSMRAAIFADHAWFERTRFDASVRAEAVVFQGDAWFGEATFAGPAQFAGGDFHGHAWFGNGTFRDRVELSDAVFRRSAGFRGAVFHQGVGLTGTTFQGPARVSRRDDAWNIAAPGWHVVIDADNESVGRLLWVGHGALIETTPV